MSNANGDCPGCAHPQPTEVEPFEASLIPKEEWRSIEATPGRAIRCGYCGCVYKINTPPVIFGYVNNPLKGKGWVRFSAAK